ncbi:xylulokinase [Alteribacillus sp. YIM 98480]|uniref:xylulokinase n=1 Tax=Alteribacillus sp. YIM 98480 TaxID=2606599 RepID=UPI00131BA057|nr:xylulokinase [Alteribacillus sp. YIM 98480]
MKDQYVLGIDHGSGGCKVTCIRSDGNIVSEAYVSYPSNYPFPGWVEQNPEQWIDAALKAISKALCKFSTSEKKNIKAMSFSAPHHVAVLLDKEGNVIRPAIMWNDQRTAEQANQLKLEFGEQIYEITYNAPNPTWTLCHLLWLKQNEPENYKQVDQILFMKDYVRYRFSGEIGTDYIEAEGSMLFDITKQEWSSSLLSLIDLNPKVLPSVYTPTTMCGEMCQDMVNILGLSSGVKIIIGTADTAAEVFGCGTLAEGDGVIKLATAGNFTVVSSKVTQNKKLTTYHHLIDNLYYQNSATNFSAASFRWFKENFYKEFEENMKVDSVYPEIMKHIEQVKPGSEGLIFQPYLNGERSPHWDPHLRGSFFGCTARHTRGHFARAVLEGVGFSLRDCQLQFPDFVAEKMRVIGGGSKGREWVQILADILKVELEVPLISDASFGVALLAGQRIGWFNTFQEAVFSTQSVKTRISPNSKNFKVYDEMFDIYQKLHSRTYDLTHCLSNMQKNLLNC